ncbi:hypothetical protein NDU88_001016 [Pleurodeles waltl]|uniref:Uncharacterized protein n=1 Tax=Pleurodeles waltl TaxID=8319 RepID=A0AAV7Q321_PLEWA|nr:hypothetical protein NDU88_001016 [Pleurodeles waltl]
MPSSHSGIIIAWGLWSHAQLMLPYAFDKSAQLSRMLRLVTNGAHQAATPPPFFINSSDQIREAEKETEEGGVQKKTQREIAPGVEMETEKENVKEIVGTVPTEVT